MSKKYLYILITLIFFSINLIYLIVKEKYQVFKDDQEIQKIQIENTETKKKIDFKNDRLLYKKTNASYDKIAKNELNRKNPGEEVVVMVSEEDVNNYKKIDVMEQISGKNVPQKNLETANMTNLEKRIYYILTKRKG
ncbi:MAG: hypothetical protein PHF26_00725 [Candidatus Gracilibacteria bacterium]|nr:hypothetical protein [Candidatus Gracilibacteria bacterium]